MAKDVAVLTESEFQAYERVRTLGHFNMLDPGARLASGLDKETYNAVLTYYKELRARFPNVRKS